MKKGFAALAILVFSAVILSYYSGIMNRKLVEVSGYSGHVTTETSLNHPTSHASQDTIQMGATDSHTTASSWQITQATLKTMATESTGVSTQSAGPATLTDGAKKVPQESTQTATTVNTDTPAAPGSSTTIPRTEWSSTLMAQTTMAAQNTTSVNTNTSPLPGSSTTTPRPEWSSTIVAQTALADQSKAGHPTLGMASVMTPPDNQTSLTASATTTTTKGKTTQAINSTTTPHVTATTSSVTTTAGPTLVPQPSSPQTGTYLVYNGSRACMKADMGVQLLIQDKTYPPSQMYFNLSPNVTRASGSCGPRRTNLLLTFPGGFVNLTFVKVKQSYHLETVEASLTITALVKVYSGLKGGLTMFATKVGHSFKCISEQTVELSSYLQLHTVNVQLQAFDFDGEHFGNADECFSDKNRRAIPVAVGLSIAGLLGVLLTAGLVARKRPGRGYELIECTSDYTIMIPVIIVIVIPLCILALVFCGIRLRRKSLGYQRI